MLLIQTNLMHSPCFRSKCMEWVIIFAFIFGIHLLLLGYLLYIAEIFPRYLGVLLFIGGICYILNSIVWFQFPLLVKYIYPAIIIPSAIGEWIFCIWLIVRGIKLSSNGNDS